MIKKILLPAGLLVLLTVQVAGCKEHVKEPAVAGSFYPSDKKTLSETVDGFLAKVEDRSDNGKLIALIAPHAGYQYSGQVAAYTYKQLKKRDIRTVILIGPSHHVAFDGAAIYAKGSLKTPLGKIKVDERLAESLLSEEAQVTFNEAPFVKEHSLEVQLPFLQRVLKDFKVVPILIGSPTRASFQHLTEKIRDILHKNEKAILIASTDLSHYHDYDTAVGMDRKIIDAVARMSLEDVEKHLSAGESEMCGGYPVIYTMAIARSLGATNGQVYKHANSGDVTDEKGRVVGYAAIGLYKSTLTKAEQDELLALAKKTITDYVTERKVPGAETNDPRLAANGATFVTINEAGNLRGCIGNIVPVMPLYKSVITNAVSASSRDPRFKPMSKEELKHIEVEISVLSPLEPLKEIREIEIGKHGLYIMKGQNSGILLPQVAAQYKWDRETFLEQVALKAGLQKNDWKDAGLFIFTADIIK